MTTADFTLAGPGAQAPAEDARGCRNCGAEYYPSDTPERLACVGPYGWCADCRAEFVADMAEWQAVAS